MMLPAYLKQVQPTAPGGCQSPRLRETIEDFLAQKRSGARKACLMRLRLFAQFQNQPRASWPRAIEHIFLLPREEACRRFLAFRRWIELNMGGAAEPGIRKGTALFSFSCFMKDRGLIEWTFPDAHSESAGAVWFGCTPSFRLKVEEWLELHRTRNYAAKSIDCTAGSLRALGGYLKERGLEYWAVDVPAASEWIGSLKSNGRWSDRTIRGLVYKARLFYQWLAKRKVVAENPFEEIGPFKAMKKLPVFLTEAEMLSCIRNSRGRLERAVIEFLYATGCRGGEMTTLNLSDLSMESKTIKCVGKGRRERMLLFNKATVEALRSYLRLRTKVLKKTFREAEPALFVGPLGYRIRLSHIQAIVKSVARRTGIKKHIGPHAFRHSYATHLLNHGADLYSLMTLMGHKCIESTTIYLHVATDRLAEVYRRCHPRK